MEQLPENINDEEIFSILGIPKEESDISSSKNQFSQEHSSGQPHVEARNNIKQLQGAADYFVIKETIGATPIYTLGVSIGAIIAALGGLYQSREITSLLIAFLVLPVPVIALFSLLRPSAKVMILQGIVLILGGVWCFSAGIKLATMWYTACQNALPRNRPDTPPLMSMYFLAGFSAIIWGIPHFSRYARFLSIPLKKPADKDIDLVRKIAKSVASVKPEASSDTITFVAQTFWGKEIWKGRLSGNEAVFVQGDVEDIIFSTKEHTWINKIDKSVSSETQKVVVKIKTITRTFDATISVVFLNLYKQWKEG